MSPQAQKEYTEIMHLRYKNATRKEKSNILDEYCATCQCHRKHGIRKLRGFKRFTKPKPRKRGRRAIYHKPDITTALKTIWLAANLPCSKRLKAILPLWLSGYEQTYGKLAEDVYQALVMISAATIDRFIASQPPGVYLSGAIPRPSPERF